MDIETRDLILQLCSQLRRGDIGVWEPLKKVMAAASLANEPADRYELIEAIVISLLPDGVRRSLFPG